MKALIVQGGGFKGAFSAGVLDAFMQASYNPFEIYAGVSAGAIAMSYYVSNQPKKCFESMRFLCNNNKFIDYSNIFKGKPVMDVDVFHAISTEHFPFEFEKACEAIANKKFAIVMTNMLNGSPSYHTPTLNTWKDAVIASCAIPFASKGNQKVNQIPHMDGAWSDPLPIKWAIDQGATEIVILRTCTTAERKNFSLMDRIGAIRFRSNPALQVAFKTNHLKYNEAVDLIESRSDLKIIQIAPEKNLNASVYSNTLPPISQDYEYGFQMGKDYLRKYS